MMVILCDRYGNEKTLLLKKDDFAGKLLRIAKKPAKRRRKDKMSLQFRIADQVLKVDDAREDDRGSGP